jgi:hypothetical protein
MPQRKLIKDIGFLRSTKMVLGRFENNLHNIFYPTFQRVVVAHRNDFRGRDSHRLEMAIKK